MADFLSSEGNGGEAKNNNLWPGSESGIVLAKSNPSCLVIHSISDKEGNMQIEFSD